MIQARPVYLTLPTDLVFAHTPRARLQIPLDIHPPPNDADAEDFVLDEIVAAVQKAEGNVVILVDACAVRHHVRAEVAALIESTGFPVYAAPMGKTAVSEGGKRYGGVSGLLSLSP